MVLYIQILLYISFINIYRLIMISLIIMHLLNKYTKCMGKVEINHIYNNYTYNIYYQLGII